MLDGDKHEIGCIHNVSKRSKPQTIEYAFRFAKGTDTEQARMAEMIRVNLAALVEQVILTCDGQEVSVDGFSLRDEPDVIYPLNQSVTQAAATPVAIHQQPVAIHQQPVAIHQQKEIGNA